MLSTRWTCAPAVSASAQAITRPGKAGAGPEIDPASGVRRERAEAEANRRRGGSRSSGRSSGAIRLMSSAASSSSSSTNASSRADVSRETGSRAPERDRRSVRRSSRLAGARHGMSRGDRRRPLAAGRAGRAPTSKRQRRRRHAVDAARLADGARAEALQLLPDLRATAPASPRSRALRQLQAFVAAVGCDVGGLAVQIDRVFGVDLELLGDVRRESRRSCGQMRATSGNADDSDRTAVRTRCAAGRPD